MYKTQPHSPSKTFRDDLRQKAQTILTKIEGTHYQIEENKFVKFKKFLSEIADIEGIVDAELAQKKRLYDVLLGQINALSKELQEEELKSKKMQLHLNNRLQNFIKVNEKAFEKIRTEREATQQRIQAYLDQKIDFLVKKTLTYKTPQVPIQHYREELQAIKNAVNKFFKDAQLEEQKAKKQIFNVIEQCAALLEQQQLQRTQAEAIEYMRVIHMQIVGRVNKLAIQRQKMQQQVLSLLERVCTVTMSSTTSTLV